MLGFALFCVAGSPCFAEGYEKSTLFTFKPDAEEKTAIKNQLFDLDDEERLYIYLQDKSLMKIYDSDGSLKESIPVTYRAGDYTYLRVSGGCYFFCPKWNRMKTDVFEVFGEKWSRINEFISMRNFVNGCVYGLWSGELAWCSNSSKEDDEYYGLYEKYKLIYGEKSGCLENKAGNRTDEINGGYIFVTAFNIDTQGNLYLIFRIPLETTDEDGNVEHGLGDSKIVKYDADLKYVCEWKDKIIKVRRSDSSVYAIEMNDSKYKILKWSERH